jgi:hypothetical protein
MADEEKTKDEVVEEKVDEVVADDKTTEEKTAADAEEKEQKSVDAMKEFDDQIDEEDNPVDEEVDDGEEKDDPAEEEVEEKVTAPDSMDAAADALEEEQKVEAAKSDEQKATEKAEAKVKADEEAEAAEAEKEEPYDCGLKTEGDDPFDVELVETLNKQGQVMQDRAKKAEADNDKLVGLLNRQADQRTLDWLDTKFNALDENFTEALGEGEFDDLEPGSDQQLNRRKVSARIAVVWEAYETAGKPIPSRNKLFSMAVNKLFNKESKQPENDKKTIKKATARSKQSLGSGSKKATVVSKATSNAQKQKSFDNLIDED